MKNTFSASEMYKWHRDREGYMRLYIEGIQDPPNDKMKLGTLIHNTIQDNRFPLIEEMKKEGYSKKQMLAARKAVSNIPSPEKSEIFMSVEYGNVKLVGFADGLGNNDSELIEYKTTDNPQIWNQRNVDMNDQLSFYALIRYLKHHSYWKGIRLIRVNTITGSVRRYETARGYRDVQYMKDKVDKTILEIKDAGLWESRLSRKEIDRRNQGQLELISEKKDKIKGMPDYPQAGDIKG